MHARVCAKPIMTFMTGNCERVQTFIRTHVCECAHVTSGALYSVGVLMTLHNH